MAAPRLTNDILKGFDTVMAHATAGGQADIGLADNGPEEEEGNEQWEQVLRAHEWLVRMFAHRRGEKIEDPPPHIPAAVLRGLQTAFLFAESDVEADQATREPRLSAQKRRDFWTASGWVDQLAAAARK